MPIPGVHLETLHNPVRYTQAQVEFAVSVASFLHRGRFVLCEPPKR